MRLLLSTAVLLVAAATASAESFTGTSGVQYTRAADGQFYPSEYVRPNGSVSPPSSHPTQQVPVYRQSVPQFYYVPQQSCPSCSGGRCYGR